MSESNQRKYWSFMEIVKAKSKNGEFNHITVKGPLCNGERRYTNDGKAVYSGSIPVNNRAKALNYALGTNFPENDETHWLNVSFWDTNADRIEKFLNGRKSAQIIVCGSIKVNNYQDRNGQNQIGLNVSVSNWTSAGGNSSESSESGEQSDSQSNNQRSAANNYAAPPTNMAQSVGFQDLDDDEDGDLPF